MERLLAVTLMLMVLIEGRYTSSCGEGDSCDENAEARLIKDLFRSYSSIARPVKDVSQAVPAQLGLSLINIADFDAENAAITLRIWTRAVWTDEFLQWDPSDYSGVSQISVPSKMTWNPDFHAYNALGEVHDEIQNVVMSGGTVMSIRPVSHKAQCVVESDYGDVPKTYNCSIKFGSWTGSKSQIALQDLGYSSPIDTVDYINSHPKCQLVSSTGEVVDKTYEGHGTYQSLNVSLKITC